MFIPFTLEQFLARIRVVGDKWTDSTVWYLAHHPRYEVHTIEKKPARKNILIEGEDPPPPALRVIHEPCPALKMAQWWILRYILTPAAKLLLPCAHGCVPGRSTLTNALPHVGAAWKAHMDVKDFFPSITTQRAYGLFAKTARYEQRLSWLLAHLCTYEGRLPQGAPTSPMIANLIATPMDHEILRLVGAMGGFYTRYVDDLTFSFRRRISRASQDRFLGTIKKISKRHGFRINDEKTSAHSRKNRMIVTGVVVNSIASIPKHFRKNLRAAAHHRRLEIPGCESEEMIRGKLAYINMINPSQAVATRRSCGLA
jgi:hypothetical protein